MRPTNCPDFCMVRIPKAANSTKFQFTLRKRNSVRNVGIWTKSLLNFGMRTTGNYLYFMTLVHIYFSIKYNISVVHHMRFLYECVFVQNCTELSIQNWVRNFKNQKWFGSRIPLKSSFHRAFWQLNASDLSICKNEMSEYVICLREIQLYFILIASRITAGKCVIKQEIIREYVDVTKWPSLG